METFLTYCNTRQFLTNRWKGEIFSNSFYLSDAELKRWHVTRVQLEAMSEIKTVGLNKYNVIDVGCIDISLVRPHGQPLTDLHSWMLKRVCETELPVNIECTQYWNSFIKHCENNSEQFFTVDNFSGRIHTPISGMRRDLRPLLLLRGEKTCSFDVAQMQPTLLAKILTANVGGNDFSKAIDNGTDIYILLQKKANLSSRDEAKKLLFKILFGYPSKALSELFGDADWINWINDYKSRTENRNTHQSKPHTNLAWLLQNIEVKLMSQVWQKLAEAGLPFLSVHDEIICRQSDELKVLSIFNSELSKHFINFKITLK